MSVRKRVSVKSPVRENRTQGSVGGSPSNGRSYPAKKTLSVAVMALFLGMHYSLKAGDGGYRFLNWSQKSELINKGEITDEEENIYDIWIVPGYVPPSKYAWDEGWVKGGRAFVVYGEKNFYSNMLDGMTGALSWGWKDCFMDSMVKKIPVVWSENFSEAGSLVDRRVFGWPLAYPTAACKSFADNVFRVPIVLCGTMFASVAGTVGIPVGEMLRPVGEGCGRTILFGVMTPVCGYTFNSMIAPPLAFFGEVPTQESVDGDWVTVKPSAQAIKKMKLSEADKKLIAKWGRFIYKKILPVEKKIDNEKNAYERKRNALTMQLNNLENQSQKKLDSLKSKRENIITSLTKNPEYQALISALTSAGLNPRKVSKNRGKLRFYFRNEGMSEKQINKILVFIDRYYKHSVPASTRRKIEPVTDSLETATGIMNEK